jgi:hypothetical protein
VIDWLFERLLLACAFGCCCVVRCFVAVALLKLLVWGVVETTGVGYSSGFSSNLHNVVN